MYELDCSMYLQFDTTAPFCTATKHLCFTCTMNTRGIMFEVIGTKQFAFERNLKTLVITVTTKWGLQEWCLLLIQRLGLFNKVPSIAEMTCDIQYGFAELKYRVVRKEVQKETKNKKESTLPYTRKYHAMACEG